MVSYRYIMLQSKIVHRSSLFLLLSLLASTSTACSYLGYGSEEYSCSGLPTGTKCMSARDVYLSRKELVNDNKKSFKNDTQKSLSESFKTNNSSYELSYDNSSPETVTKIEDIQCNNIDENNGECKAEELNYSYLNTDSSTYRLHNELLVQNYILENINRVEKHINKKISQIESIEQVDISNISNNNQLFLKDNLKHPPLKKYQITFNSYVDNSNVYHHKHDVVIFDIPVKANSSRNSTFSDEFRTHNRLLNNSDNDNRSKVVIYSEELDKNENNEELSSDFYSQYSDSSKMLDGDSLEQSNYNKLYDDYYNNDKLFSINSLTDEIENENIKNEFDNSSDKQNNLNANKHTNANNVTSSLDLNENPSFNPATYSNQNHLNFNNNKVITPLFNRTNK